MCFNCVSISLVICYELVGGSERTGGDPLISRSNSVEFSLFEMKVLPSLKLTVRT